MIHKIGEKFGCFSLRMFACACVSRLCVHGHAPSIVIRTHLHSSFTHCIIHAFINMNAHIQCAYGMQGKSGMGIGY